MSLLKAPDLHAQGLGFGFPLSTAAVCPLPSRVRLSLQYIQGT